MEALFATPVNHSPRISPDGATLALVHRGEHQQLVMTQPLGGGELRPIARLRDPERQIRWLEWAGPGRLLARLDGPDGRQLISIPATGGTVQALPESEILSMVPGDPEHVVVAVQGEGGPAASRMHLVTGALERLAGPEEGVVAWHVDPKGRVRAATLSSGGLRVRADGTGPFQTLPPATGPVSFAGFGEKDDQLYLFGQSPAHRRGVYELSLPSLETRKVFAHSEYDVAELELDGRGVAVGARYLAYGPKTFYFTPEVILERVNLDGKLSDTDNRVLSASLDGSKQLILSQSDVRAPRVLLYDRAKARVDPILSLHPDIRDEQLSATEPVLFEAPDSVQIPAFLTLPKGGGRKDLPTLILVHDGPRSRDAVSWDPRVQLFASRGFAVFQIQYRGSFGYGRAHEQGGYGHWGLRMQEDVAAGAQWLSAIGISDPERLVIHGSGYGGYVAMQSLVATPTLYAAASSLGGFFDLDPFAPAGDSADSAATDGAGVAPARWRDYVLGPRPRGLAALRAVSPLHRAGDIQRPVFLAHGSEDRISPVSESRRLAEALTERGHAVTWLELEGAGHELEDEASRLRFYRELLAFYQARVPARAERDEQDEPASAGATPSATSTAAP